jgi:hypothetical protein
VQGNVAVSVGRLSYAGQLNVEVAADAEVVPDLPIFAAGIERDLHALTEAGMRRVERPLPYGAHRSRLGGVDGPAVVGPHGK